jgi:hypothetical protein
MHVEADLLDSVREVGAGERQVLKGPGEAPKVCQISNRRSRLSRDLGLCVHRCRNWLPVHHASSLKNIESKLTLVEEGSVHLMLYRDSQKMEGPRSFMANSCLRADIVCYRSAALDAMRTMSST